MEGMRMKMLKDCAGNIALSADGKTLVFCDSVTHLLYSQDLSLLLLCYLKRTIMG